MSLDIDAYRDLVKDLEVGREYSDSEYSQISKALMGLYRIGPDEVDQVVKIPFIDEVADSHNPLPSTFAFTDIFTPSIGDMTRVVNRFGYSHIKKQAFFFSGIKLDEFDRHVYSILLKMAKDMNFDSKITISNLQLVKALGIVPQRQSYDRLKKSLRNIALSHISFFTEKSWGVFHLLSFDWSEDGFSYSIPSSAKVVFDTNVIFLDSAIEKRLVKNQFASKLYSILSTQRKGVDNFLTFNVLEHMYDSNFGRDIDFRVRIKKSCERLTELGVIEEYSVSKHPRMGYLLNYRLVNRRVNRDLF